MHSSSSYFYHVPASCYRVEHDRIALKVNLGRLFRGLGLQIDELAGHLRQLRDGDAAARSYRLRNKLQFAGRDVDELP